MSLRFYDSERGTVTASYKGSWLPGIFDSRDTARACFEKDPTCALMQRLQDAANARTPDFEKRVITMEDVEAQP